jgi:hypothetical protein
LPDESLDAFLLPRWPLSGLVGNPNPFTDNLLVDPRSPQKVVHPKALGYAVDPGKTFVSSSGTVMMPYPLNRGSGPLQSYTWRDTTVLAEAGPDNAGIPMDIEEGPPLFLEPEKGTIAGAGEVPSIGLSLLLEYRCYPTDRGLGLNALDVSLAINSSALPAFRAFSSGGFNTQGLPVVVDPDAENVPLGGFNPNSSPPGRRTRPIDNAFYLGQLDLVYRVSRVHSVWLDTATAAPDYAVLQLGDILPGSTSVAVEVRGALGFSTANTAPFDAARLDAYGDQVIAVPIGIRAWSPQLDDADGARYVQLRLAFINDLAAGATPELDWLGLGFER